VKKTNLFHITLCVGIFFITEAAHAIYASGTYAGKVLTLTHNQAASTATAKSSASAITTNCPTRNVFGIRGAPRAANQKLICAPVCRRGTRLTIADNNGVPTYSCN